MEIKLLKKKNLTLKQGLKQLKEIKLIQKEEI